MRSPGCSTACSGHSTRSSRATHGNLLGRHPHIHALVTDGAFGADGTFHPVPAVPAEVLSELARRTILSWLVSKERIGAELAERISSWRHYGGFRVRNAVTVSAEDVTWEQGADPDAERPAERLLRYLGRGPYAEKHARLSTDETTFLHASRMKLMPALTRSRRSRRSDGGDGTMASGTPGIERQRKRDERTDLHRRGGA